MALRANCTAPAGSYFLVTFTIPSALRAIFRSRQRLCYDLLFTQSAGTLQDVARQPRYLCGDLGMLGVLHTCEVAEGNGGSW
jgi:hypothetical protein